MGVHCSFHAALAALLGAALGHGACEAQPQEQVRPAQVSANATPAPSADRSELWLFINTQRSQPEGAGVLAAHDLRRLTPEQRVQLREQVRRAYDRPASKAPRH